MGHTRAATLTRLIAMQSLLLALFACLLVQSIVASSSSSSSSSSDDAQSGRFSWTDSTSSDSSSDSSSSSSDSSLSSSSARGARALRDQRRIELAVQEALLQDRIQEPFPATPSYRSQSYQLQMTTLLDALPDDAIGLSVANPVFGPAAIVSYVSPLDGLWGPARTRAQVEALDTQTSFGRLFQEVRKAGFLGEFELRTLVQSDQTFSLRTPALLTPCFPVTDEPALTFEMVALAQNAVGQLRMKLNAADTFFDDDRQFITEPIRFELPLSRYNAEARQFETTEDRVAIATISPCDQFSYFQ